MLRQVSSSKDTSQGTETTNETTQDAQTAQAAQAEQSRAARVAARRGNIRAPRRTPLKTLDQSSKLQNVLYDIRGPVTTLAEQMEADGPPHHDAQHRQSGKVRL